MQTLENLIAKAEAAHKAYEEGFGQLFRDAQHREKLYSDDEHESRVRALHLERASEIDAVVDEIRSLADDAHKELAVLESGDPTSVLEPDELQTAATKRPFATDDVWATSQHDLPAKLRAVLDGGDRSAIFAYWRAASGRFGHGSPERAPVELTEVLEEMRQTLAGPERLARAERARKTTKEAMAAEAMAGRLKSGSRSAAEAWSKRRFTGTYGRR